MFIKHALLKAFRCFTERTITFERDFILIEGTNGTGKTSLIEALHYACHLRSFRTRIPRELIAFDAAAFSIAVTTNEHDIHVGCSADKRLVKVDNAPITHYKELVNQYRVITCTDDDSQLIRGAPEMRRAFLDTTLSLANPEYAMLTRRYTQVLNQRTALLSQPRVDKTEYDLWTEQLSTLTHTIRMQRAEAVAQLQAHLAPIAQQFSGLPAIQLSYQTHSLLENYGAEVAARRTLWGAHLDDCRITLDARDSKQYASRGAQHLIALLLKSVGAPAGTIFLLDDTLSDLDAGRREQFLDLVRSQCSQVIITIPAVPEHLVHYCTRVGGQKILLS